MSNQFNVGVFLPILFCLAIIILMALLGYMIVLHVQDSRQASLINRHGKR